MVKVTKWRPTWGEDRARWQEGKRTSTTTNPRKNNNNNNETNETKETESDGRSLVHRNMEKLRDLCHACVEDLQGEHHQALVAHCQAIVEAGLLPPPREEGTRREPLDEASYFEELRDETSHLHELILERMMLPGLNVPLAMSAINAKIKRSLKRLRDLSPIPEATTPSTVEQEDTGPGYHAGAEEAFRDLVNSHPFSDKLTAGPWLSRLSRLAGFAGVDQPTLLKIAMSKLTGDARERIQQLRSKKEIRNWGEFTAIIHKWSTLKPGHGRALQRWLARKDNSNRTQ